MADAGHRHRWFFTRYACSDCGFIFDVHTRKVGHTCPRHDGRWIVLDLGALNPEEDA